jgi:hypothetical protein
MFGSWNPDAADEGSIGVNAVGSDAGSRKRYNCLRDAIFCIDTVRQSRLG